MTAHVRVPGLGLIHDFITEAEEEALLTFLDAQPWDESAVFRRTQHYGAAAIDFKKRDIQVSAAIPPIPAFCLTLLERAGGYLQSESSSSRNSISARDQMTVNDYKPGEGIANHIDIHSLFEDGFLVISLSSAYVMDFKLTLAPSEQEDGKITNDMTTHKKALLLPQRSLLILQGEARYRWSHGIASRRTDKVNGMLVRRGRRVSLSFRRLRHPPICDCAFSQTCDSRKT